ncbi:endolytic transglycosylase MltG [Streptacidiphilus sp. ASG 303]|uniref:endolytic transglycosylase MltG n=1 Tax=Streptacidiphilus sp. ASG 303 TaxID=2896847 RepID=UPI001E325D0B|nr:endolytic transglycosylase MltG [Streptacidiphilus sp. ASG 303]MCD0481208.1 endolytic transglycosylase MltG [Streptacidiphilus sp. ASG 303]
MTDLGRGYGSQPWSAGDPLYGDLPGGPDGGRGRPYGGPGHQGQQYGGQGGWPADPYGQPQQPGYPQQPQHPGQGYPQQHDPRQHDTGGYQQYPGPYGQPQYPHPVPQQQGPEQGGHGWEAPPGAAPGHDASGRDASGHDAPWADDESWQDGEEHADEPEEAEEGSFFGPQDDSRGAERRRKQQGRKSGRRNGGACLVVSLVLVGVLGGGGYYGYTFYQDHFGPPPDFAGPGNGSVQVEVKSGASVGDMALALKQAGVIKSAGAFLEADKADGGKAQTIQPGFYTLKHEMSASGALKLMLLTLGGDNLVIREGARASEVYAMIDQKLKLDKGTTASVARRQRASLGLPAYAGGNPEGFLFPTRYSIGKSTKPVDILKQMVSNAKDEYAKLGVEEGAKRVGLASAHEVITEASIVQAEGFDSNDFGKVARVIYNRLHWQGHPHLLGMDSTLNYARGVSTLDNSYKDTQFKSPYNTYTNPGLPPGPIGNPGEEAIKAVLNPEPGDWHFFTTVKGHETRFEVTQQEHDRNVAEFNRNRQNGG